MNKTIKNIDATLMRILKRKMDSGKNLTYFEFCEYNRLQKLKLGVSNEQ